MTTSDYYEQRHGAAMEYLRHRVSSVADRVTDQQSVIAKLIDRLERVERDNSELRLRLDAAARKFVELERKVGNHESAMADRAGVGGG